MTRAAQEVGPRRGQVGAADKDGFGGQGVEGGQAGFGSYGEADGHQGARGGP